MPTERTHISVILDRTGSMEPIRDDTIGGFNTFLAQQKEMEGMATLTLVQFDSEDPFEVIHHFRDLADVSPLDRRTFVPRAATPLLDAIGRGIRDLDNSLERLDPELRPARIVFVVVTDGQENASREYSRAKVTRLIEQRDKAGWQFVFLSADLEAIRDAESVGFRAQSTMVFDKDARGSRRAWETLSTALYEYRSDVCADMSLERPGKESTPA
jgi:hypothetical protein